VSAAAVPAQLLPSRKFHRSVAAALLLVVCWLLFIWLSDVDWAGLTDTRGLVILTRDIFPPNFSILWRSWDLYHSLSETVAMAFLGSLAGCFAAAVCAFFAARNTSPNAPLRLAARGVLSVIRSIPPFVVVLFFLIAVGIGPFAGMLSIFVSSIGIFGKFFADAIEQVNQSVTDAMGAIGAGRLQVICYGILPQVKPAFIATLLYAFDVNLRLAIALGIFGGGGMGFQLELASRVLRYHDMLAYTLFVIVLITLTERISDALRRRILNQDLH
jgi:phosphonate transport system permease protein